MPNPATDQLIISGIDGDFKTVEILTAQGKSLKKIEITKAGSLNNSVMISLHEIPNGLYFLRFQSTSKSLTKQLLVSK